MVTNPTDPFIIDGRVTGRFEERAAHIADITVPTDYDDILFEDNTYDSRRNDQILCSKGTWWGRDVSDDLRLSEAAKLYDFNTTSFDAEAPDKICSHCWKKANEKITKLRTIANSDLILGDVGYRMRWKQKGKTSSRWVDIVVSPAATMERVDDIIASAFRIGNRYYRVYGLEGEYSESSIGLMPEGVYERMGHPSDQNATEITVGELAHTHYLWRGDRLTLAYDSPHEPTAYYCIFKEVLSEDDLSTIRERNGIDPDTQAFIVKNK